jgi:hypothetical protein
MTAPLFVKGGVPVPFSTGDASVLELSVWMPPTATACTSGTADTMNWSEIYDDDGETTRYKEHGEHWRSRAGFARCSPATVALQVTVASASWPTPHQAVRWTIKAVAGPVRRAPGVHLACTTTTTTTGNSDDDAGVAVDATWTHVRELKVLRVLVSLEHRCTVHFSNQTL